MSIFTDILQLEEFVTGLQTHFFFCVNLCRELAFGLVFLKVFDLKFSNFIHKQATGLIETYKLYPSCILP